MMARPLIGYRLWEIGWEFPGNVLDPGQPIAMPMVSNIIPTWSKRTATATCSMGRLIEHLKESAAQRTNIHGCGLYSLSRIQDLLEEFNNVWYINPDDLFVFQDNFVVGVVGNHGTVVEGERGYRAEKAAILSLFIDEFPDRNVSLISRAISENIHSLVPDVEGLFRRALRERDGRLAREAVDRVLRYEPYLIAIKPLRWESTDYRPTPGEAWIATYSLSLDVKRYTLNSFEDLLGVIRNSGLPDYIAYRRESVHGDFIYSIFVNFFAGVGGLRFYIELVRVVYYFGSYGQLVGRLGRRYGVPVVRVPDHVLEWARARGYRR